MKRDFNKLIEAGAQMLESHPRQDMALSEVITLINNGDPREVLTMIYDSYCAGVAAGVRISEADNARRGEQ